MLQHWCKITNMQLIDSSKYSGNVFTFTTFTFTLGCMLKTADFSLQADLRHSVSLWIYYFHRATPEATQKEAVDGTFFVVVLVDGI